MPGREWYVRLGFKVSSFKSTFSKFKEHPTSKDCKDFGSNLNCLPILRRWVYFIANHMNAVGWRTVLYAEPMSKKNEDNEDKLCSVKACRTDIIAVRKQTSSVTPLHSSAKRHPSEYDSGSRLTVHSSTYDLFFLYIIDHCSICYSSRLAANYYMIRPTLKCSQRTLTNDHLQGGAPRHFYMGVPPTGGFETALPNPTCAYNNRDFTSEFISRLLTKRTAEEY